MADDDILIPGDSSGAVIPIGGDRAALSASLNRRATLEFIAEDPIQVQLERSARVDDGAGGTRRADPQNVPVQQVRLIPQSDVQTSVTGPDGVQLLPAYVLLLAYDADVDRWDEFTHDGVGYIIVSTIRPEYTDNAYQKKADVARR